MTVPDFTDDGTLPPGEHPATMDELKEKLGFSHRRLSLIEGLERALRVMREHGVERVYLDGSFVTDKPVPGDIDGCYDAAQDADLLRMYPIFPPSPANQEKAKEVYGVHLFPSEVEVSGRGEPFLRFFKKDREGRERGVVVIELEGETQ